MSEELNNLVDDILKEKLKLHYENEELEAQGKLIKELCKENEQLHSIIKEVREYIEDIMKKYIDYELAIDGEHILEILGRENNDK